VEVFMPPAAGVARSRRFAYALFSPPAAAPGYLLRRALEERGGNPTVGLAASDYGALFVIFGTPEARDVTMELFPLELEGHRISLERPEEGCNRFKWSNSCFVHISATGFPLEHWDEEGICTAFCSVGSVCCVGPLCVDELDFSAVRLVLKLEHVADLPAALLVRDALGDASAQVTIRMVSSWPCADDGVAPGCIHYASSHNRVPSHAPAGGPRRKRLSDIDSGSELGLPPSPAQRLPPASSVLNLWGRIVARRQDDLARAAALEEMDGLPANSSCPLPTGAPVPPTELWDSILARRLASQFPETGMDASQVENLAAPFLFTLFPNPS
jgi:hypothetical protein